MTTPQTPELPTGTVTFRCTDVEGSTRLREQHPDQMRLALARHDAHDDLIEALVAQHAGGAPIRALRSRRIRGG